MKKFKTIAATVMAATMLTSCSGDGVERIPEKPEDKIDNDVEMSFNGECGECFEKIEEDYVFCPYCGIKQSEIKFRPEDNDNPAVYGAPYDYTLHCSDCDFTMSGESEMNIPDYCPYCGQEADVEMTDALR